MDGGVRLRKFEWSVASGQLQVAQEEPKQACQGLRRATDHWQLASWQLYYFPMPELPVLHHRPHEELILIGFRVDARHDGPQFYTLLAVGGDNERPLTSDGRIVFFVASQSWRRRRWRSIPAWRDLVLPRRPSKRFAMSRRRCIGSIRNKPIPTA